MSPNIKSGESFEDFENRELSDTGEIQLEKKSSVFNNMSRLSEIEKVSNHNYNQDDSMLEDVKIS